MYQVRALAEQAITLAHRLADEAQFAMFQVTQAAMNNARGAAGNPGGEIILLDQQSALAGAGALPRHRDAIDAAPDDDNLESLAFQGSARLY